MVELSKIVPSKLGLIFIIIICCGFAIPQASAAKVLGLFAHPSESHFAVMRTLVLELTRREHNVTIYSTHRMHENVENLKEYVVEPEYPFWKELQKIAAINQESSTGGLQSLSQFSDESLQKYLGQIGSEAIDHFFKHEYLQELLRASPADFDYDLIIVDLFYSEALLAFGHYFNKPTIGVISSNFENYMQHTLESLLPIACSPVDFENFDETEESGYWKRLTNTRGCIKRRKLFAQSNFVAQEKLITKYFKSQQEITPTIAQLQRELAILLLNNHVPLATPRPMLYNTIPAGGLHIRPPRELPWHLKRFLDEARAGVVYMNLGNEQLCADIPKTQMELFFRVFSARKEHVIWTCHDADMKFENAPKNLIFQHIVPQADILAHPHVRVFIMNGDLLSLQEAIVRHVPMIGIPIFRNEQKNMLLVQEMEIGITLTSANLTEDSLNWALNSLVFNIDYATRIRQVSSTFRDRPLGALETAIYWMDYVLRHNGGAQLKTKGIGIPSSQLHLFDLFIFYFLMTLLIVGGLVGGFFAFQSFYRRRQIEKLYSKLN